ncbi:MAG: hypothetical protein CMM99_04920 [Rickettsiales bacterium]|nr:hypothetical protein [Rickettsiales bacterium]
MILKVKKIIFNILVNFLSYFVKTKKNRWLISIDGGGGSKFAENAYALTNYIEKKKEIDLKIISKKNIQEFKKRSIKLFSLKYLNSVLTSRVLIIEDDLQNDIPSYRSKDTIKINLFHGAALKKIYHSSFTVKRIYQKSFLNFLKKFLVGFCFTDEYDLVLSTNSLHQKLYKKAFQNKKVHILGQPRNDILLKKDRFSVKKKIFKKFKINFKNDPKIISYLPTFRDSKIQEENFYNLTKSDTFKKFLKKKNYIFLIKSHFYYEDNFKLSFKRKNKFKSKYIFSLSDEFLTQDLLKVSDCLVTDYSGVYFDFLLLKKPIIFYCYDYKEYLRNDRELYFNYFDDNITPGPKVKNVKDLIKSISNEMRESSYKKRISQAQKLFHKYQDNKNCARVYNFIKSID